MPNNIFQNFIRHACMQTTVRKIEREMYLQNFEMEKETHTYKFKSIELRIIFV
jgi:hypothetical protein